MKPRRAPQNTMSEQPSSFSKLLQAYERGDPEARQRVMKRAAALSKSFASQAMGRGLRSIEESIDIAQSVMLAFHVGAAAGEVELPSDQALKGYLRGMVRNKLANRSDKMKAAKRGGGQKLASLEDLEDASDTVPRKGPISTASTIVRAEELKSRIEAALSDEERTVFEGRLQGQTNAEIAQQLGKNGDAVRMIWNRARERVIRLGLVSRPGARRR